MPRIRETRTVVRSIAAIAAAGAIAGLAFAQAEDGARQLASMLLLPALMLAGGALQGVLAALFPQWTAASRMAVEDRRGVCLLWGFLIALLAVLVTVILSAIAQPLGVLGLVLVLVAGIMSVAGYVGIAAALGARLLPAAGSADDRAPLEALVGGLVLCFACLVPILGQLLAFLVLFASIGAAAVTLFRGPHGPPRP